jgi:hypothetical protein
MVFVQMDAVLIETLRELGEPLRIHERLDDSAQFVLIVLATQGP